MGGWDVFRVKKFEIADFRMGKRRVGRVFAVLIYDVVSRVCGDFEFSLSGDCDKFQTIGLHFVNGRIWVRVGVYRAV